MNFKSQILKAYFRSEVRSVPRRAVQLHEQSIVFSRLMESFGLTNVGKDLGVYNGITQRAFSEIPVIKYDDIYPYIELSSTGARNVLWPSPILYFVKTSGTTGKCKYIPMTRSSLYNQTYGPRRVLAHLTHNLGFTNLFREKALVFADSSNLSLFGCYNADSLSAHLSKDISLFLKPFIISGKTADNDSALHEKIIQMAGQCRRNHVSFAVAMPSWFNTLLSVMPPADRIKSFSSLRLISFSGMDPHPYLQAIFDKIQRKTDWIQTYPSSEGFFGYTDQLCSDSMLLLTDHLIYYEFIPVQEFGKKYAKLTLEEVRTGEPYIMIITSSNGLISYVIGDVVEFTSLDPFRFRITGRIGESINVSGELVNKSQLNKAINDAMRKTGMVEGSFNYIVFPDHDDMGRPYHKWIIELDINMNLNVKCLSENIDSLLKNYNLNYEDNRNGGVLLNPVIELVKPGSIEKALSQLKESGIQTKLKSIYSTKPDFIKFI